MMGSVIESQVPQLTVLASGLGNLSRVIETMDVSLVKANVDCEKTMKTRSMMVSVNMVEVNIWICDFGLLEIKQKVSRSFGA